MFVYPMQLDRRLLRHAKGSVALGSNSQPIRMPSRAFLLLVLQAVFSTSSHAQIIDIAAPKKSWLSSGEPTRTLYRATPESIGVLIFIPGGLGQVSLRANGQYGPQAWGHLRDYAYQVSRVPLDLVLMDSPYPVQPSSRWGGDHIDRIRSVVEEFRQRTGKPVYLYGHSLGGSDISGFLKDPAHDKLIDGAIFSAAQTPKISREIKLPVLILHNELDACSYTPASTSKSFYEEVTKLNASRTQLKMVSGGTNFGDVCTSPQSTHAYHGIHNQVTDAIDAFLKP